MVLNRLSSSGLRMRSEYLVSQTSVEDFEVSPLSLFQPGPSLWGSCNIDISINITRFKDCYNCTFYIIICMTMFTTIIIVTCWGYPWAGGISLLSSFLQTQSSMSANENMNTLYYCICICICICREPASIWVGEQPTTHIIPAMILYDTEYRYQS